MRAGLHCDVEVGDGAEVVRTLALLAVIGPGATVEVAAEGLELGRGAPS